MLCAVIDIGSNTIRLAVYDCGPDREIPLILSRKETVGLAGYVEGGALLPEGVRAACAALEKHRATLSQLPVERVFVFATAAVRNASNKAQVTEQIQKETGFAVEVISGEEEARLDFLGVMHASGASDGLVTDIGGGSCELVAFSGGRPERAVSMPLGSLSLFSRYVRELLPTKEEQREIREAVMGQLRRPEFSLGTRAAVYCVGGTLRHAAVLCGCAGEGGAAEFGIPEFRATLARLAEDPSFALEQLLRVAPDRVRSMLPGMLQFDVIAEFYGCEQAVVSPYGVREGYLLDRMGK